GKLHAHLETHPDTALADVAHTLQSGRRTFNHRSAFAAGSRDDAIERLKSERYTSMVAEDTAPPIAFMFPGQGAQYVGMGAALYSREP
ncbi:hypothetical protein, partial [Burkholderia sp. SIMBA_052]|uniref:CurL C-terminal domain-containing protein n=1 Tax=Burkholderia sp. SIMBA_052 TaxID=3085793 RepID=UPI003978A0D7